MQPQIGAWRHEWALTRIAHYVGLSPNTRGGPQLGQFLWSIQDEHHLVNLSTLVSRLDSERSALVAEVLNAALVGNLQKADIERAILVSGGKTRRDETRADSVSLRRLEEAGLIIASIARDLPPSRAHTDTVRLFRRFATLRRQWCSASDDDIPF